MVLDMSSSGAPSDESYTNYFDQPYTNAQGAIVADMLAGSFVGALAIS